MTRVRALQDHYIKDRYYKKGAIFDLPEGIKPGKSLEVVDEKGVALPKKPKGDQAPAVKPLEEMSHKELLAKAKDLGLQHDGTPSKVELVALIKEAEAKGGGALV